VGEVSTLKNLTQISDEIGLNVFDGSWTCWVSHVMLPQASAADLVQEKGEIRSSFWEGEEETLDREGRGRGRGGVEGTQGQG
jgi:hypothetical protein